jgi:hypothetical protein
MEHMLAAINRRLLKICQELKSQGHQYNSYGELATLYYYLARALRFSSVLKISFFEPEGFLPIFPVPNMGIGYHVEAPRRRIPRLAFMEDTDRTF